MRAAIIECLSDFLLFCSDNLLLTEAIAKKCFLIKFCESRSKMFGCNVCSSCKQVLSNLHPKICYFRATSNTTVDAIRELVDSSRNVCWCISNIQLLDKSIIPILLQLFKIPTFDRLVILLTSDIAQTSPLLISKCQAVYVGSRASSSDSLSLLLTEVDGKIDDLFFNLLKRRKYILYNYFKAMLRAEQDLFSNGNRQLIFNNLFFSKITDNYLDLNGI